MSIWKLETSISKRFLLLKGRLWGCLPIVLLLFAFQMARAQGRLPIRFIENQGQLHDEILYYADFRGGSIFLKANGIDFLLLDYSEITRDHFHNESEFKADDTNRSVYRVSSAPTSALVSGHYYTVRFEGANAGTRLIASDPGTEKFNYFIGSDPSKWKSDIRSAGLIHYEDIYDGIDLQVYSVAAGLKYDLIVDSGVDTDQVRITYEGLDDISASTRGLHLKTSLGEFVEEIPAAYQSGQKVSCRYRLEGNQVSFDFPEGFDRTQRITIDPLLIFSTYSGSAADNWGNTATFDSNGNLYSGGMTNHFRDIDQDGNPNFLGEFNATPGSFQSSWGGIWDVAILKYDSTGSQLEYATYLGGSDSEVPQSLVVNNAGELLILGITSSLDFPTTEGAYDRDYNGGAGSNLFGGSVPYANGSDLFLAKLSADGSELLSSTLLGGSQNDGLVSTFSQLVKNYGDQSRGDIIVDPQDNVYFVSRTQSQDFPIVGGFQNENRGSIDGLVGKFNSQLTELLWSTYIGGSGEDVALSIKLSPEGEIYIAGGTTSIDFPTTANTIHPGPTGNIDGFVARLAMDGGSLEASSYIGTTEYDQVYQMDLDSDGEVYVVGQTRGAYPITEGPRVDPNSGQFVHKLTEDLDSTLFSTVFGGGRREPDIYITAFLVNDCNNLYISGWGSPTLSSSWGPYVDLTTSLLNTTAEAHQAASDGSSFYLAVYTDDMSELLYATHLGSSSSLVHVDGGTSRFDKQGVVYHAVCASCFGGDSTFPTTPGAWSEANGSLGCNNAAFKFDLASLNARIRTNNVDLDQPHIAEGCAPFEVAFENISVGGEIYEWTFGSEYDTVSFVRDTIFHTFEEGGTYTIQLKAIDSSTCAEIDFATTSITVYDHSFEVSDSTTMCGGGFAQLSAIGGSSYLWTPAAQLSDPSAAYPRAFPDTTTVFKVDITDLNGCTYTDSVRVEVIPEIVVDVQIEQDGKCFNAPDLVIVNNSQNVESIIWDFGNGSTSDEMEPVPHFESPGVYDVTVIMVNQQCTKELTIPVTVDNFFVPNVITPNGDGKNDVFEVSSALPVQLTVFNRYGKVLYKDDNYKDDWNGGGLQAGIYYYDITFPDQEVCSGWVQILY